MSFQKIINTAIEFVDIAGLVKGDPTNTLTVGLEASIILRLPASSLHIIPTYLFK